MERRGASLKPVRRAGYFHSTRTAPTRLEISLSNYSGDKKTSSEIIWHATWSLLSQHMKRGRRRLVQIPLTQRFPTCVSLQPRWPSFRCCCQVWKSLIYLGAEISSPGALTQVHSSQVHVLGYLQLCYFILLLQYISEDTYCTFSPLSLFDTYQIKILYNNIW